MALFNYIRKSGLTTNLFVPVLTNLILFGQPLENILFQKKDVTGYNASRNPEGPFSPSHYDVRQTAHPGKAYNGFTKTNETSFARSLVFEAQEDQGAIGELSKAQPENIQDNFFSVYIPNTINLQEYEAYLVYDLFGLESASQTTKSINRNGSFGGKVVFNSDSWRTVKEPIVTGQLKNGDNEIFFNRREDVNYRYHIKNLKIAFSLKGNNMPIAHAEAINYNGKLHVQGIVQDPGISHINTLGMQIPVIKGVFDAVIPNVIKDTESISLTGSDPKVVILVPVQFKDYDALFTFEDKQSHEAGRLFGIKDVRTGVLNYHNIKIAINADATKTNSTILVEGLQFKDIKATDQDVKNVTRGFFSAYRVKSVNLPDSVAVQLHLQYDDSKIPEGYSARDIRPYYFDNKARSWKALTVDSLDTEKKEIRFTAYSNDTDYINGVIKVPESPETGNFTPTTISDMKYADPAAGVVSIQPPTPNNTGTVTTNFPLKIPQGRNGMQPSLELNYSSEAGNGWMGIGWNIATPAITLNTKWGAPLFDGDKETEMYSLNGADLVLKDGPKYTSPHRQENVSRVNNRTFYLRKEGSFQKIIRHGDDPANYWWEVTDKSGTKSFYGGYNGLDRDYVLSESLNSGNIGYWALKRVEDPQGNYIEYTYDKSGTSIPNSSVAAQKFYPSSINYTLHGTTGSSGNHYRVDFLRESGRADKTVSARNRYIHLIDDVLSEIKVSLVESGQPTTIRSYKLAYAEIQKKKQLEKISEFDSNNNLFYSNTIEYFDDLGSGNVIESAYKVVNGTTDNISVAGPISDVLDGNVGSGLGTSLSKGLSAGIRAGLGLGFNSGNVNTTLGGSFNFSYNEQDTFISLMDVNGDGLPDKLYSNGNNVFYRPNRGTNNGALLGFGDLSTLTNLNRLSKTKSRTTGGGGDLNVMGLAGVGISFSKTAGETDNYFSDINGDGLPDMVGSGNIKFNASTSSNHLQRKFENPSSATENPILTGGINLSALQGDMSFDTMDELRESYPQFDHVKVWQAPYSGTINITGQATLKSKNSYTASGESLPKDNRFRLTIEKANAGQTVGNTTSFNAVTQEFNTVGATAAMNLSSLTVNKGDVFFFRIHNKDYGYGGEVEWNPIITYTATSVINYSYVTQTDDNKKQMHIYNAAEDFVMNNDSGFSVTANETAPITINFNAPTYAHIHKFSDHIVFRIERVRIDNTTGNVVPSGGQVWSRTYSSSQNIYPNTISQSSPSFTIFAAPQNSTDQYIFSVESTSNIRWEDVNWKPTINKGGIITYPSVNYITYDENVNQSRHWIDANQLPYPIPTESGGYIQIRHNAFDQDYNVNNFLGQFSAASFPLEVNVVAKAEFPTDSPAVVRSLYRKTFYIHRLAQLSENTWDYKFTTTPDINAVALNKQIEEFLGGISADNVRSLINNSGRVYAAFYVNNIQVAVGNLSAIRFVLNNTDAANYPNYTPATIQRPFFCSGHTRFGLTYRGWSQFLYNGGIKYQRDADYNIINPIPANYGESNIDVGVFNPDSQTLSDMGANTSPEDAATNAGMIRYILYNELNQYKKFTNEAVFNKSNPRTPVTFGLANNSITATLGRFGEANLHEVYVDPASILSDNEGGAFPGMKQYNESKGKAVSFSFGPGGRTESKASSKVLNQYVDLNGDRYPEIVTKNNIQYTGMQGNYKSTRPNQNSFLPGDESEDTTDGITVAPVKPNSTASNEGKVTGNKTISNTGSGLNVSSGSSKDARQWVDMNGDGLTDQVKITSSTIDVWLNTGYGFTDMIIWGSGYDIKTNVRQTGSGSVTFGNASFAFGFGTCSSFADLNAGLIDVNGDALPDLVFKNGNFKYYLNTGSGFAPSTATFYPGGSIERDVALAGSTFAAYSYGSVIFSTVIITIKFVASLSGSPTASFNEKIISVQDFDGDGYPDVLTKSNLTVPKNNSSLLVNLNRTGKTHLLKKVNTPLGGSWAVTYERTGNTYDMPQSKWVLTKIDTHDGFIADEALKPSQTTVAVEYTAPKYDRREREFYGFKTVKIKQYNDNTVYRTQVKTYHNNNYYLTGAVKTIELFNSSNQKLSEENIMYNLLNPDQPVVDLEASVQSNYLQANIVPAMAPTVNDLFERARLFVTVVKTGTISFEAGSGIASLREFKVFDNRGNLRSYVDHGQTADDTYQTSIEYFESIGQIENSTGYPKKISVFKNGTTELYRQREATYYDTGKLEQVITKLNNDDDYNTLGFEYDEYGNLITVNDLDNLNADGTTHFVKHMVYDDIVHTYPVSISNSFGESSSMEYNYLFGIPVFTTDVNNQSLRTRIDTRGRVVEVTGPNELALESSGPAWTIRMDYEGETPVEGPPDSGEVFSAQGKFEAVEPGDPQPSTAKHPAITRHFDPEYASNTNVTTNELVTISLVDGFGIPLQVKKKHKYSNGGTNTMAWLVSGFEKKDALGRTLMTYYPAIQNAAVIPVDYFTLPASTPAVTTTYDAKDRVLTVKQPGESQVSQVAYTIEGGLFVQRMTNELGQKVATFTDSKGRQVKTVQNDELTTTFKYNTVNELVKVIDNQGRITNYKYDLAGRKLESQHPDRGITKVAYDKAGRMTEQSNSKLINAEAQPIKYFYDHSRLIRIAYPQNAQHEVKYAFGDPDDTFAVSQNAVGRLLYQEDASGVQVFGYGRMGEVTENLRSLAVAGYQSYWFLTRWKYDSWNRVQEIVYPDEEKVSYEYNQAGMLNAIDSHLQGLPNVQPIVTSIGYDQYGDRSIINYGNETSITYTYDTRRRLTNLSNTFANFAVQKQYTYDALSNITKIETVQPQNSLPSQAGQIGGPVSHFYQYDTYNRLTQASGTYTGAMDTNASNSFLRQSYVLDMEYNPDHTIKKKTQSHTQGIIDSYGGTPATSYEVQKTNYTLKYEGYNTGTYAAGDYTYQQPHAPRIITELPTSATPVAADDPRVRNKEILYDANGNQTEIKETVGPVVTSLRKNLWDEENRLIGVNLKPDDATQHPVAVYTYDAAGQRTIRYNYDHIDVYSNSTEVAQGRRENVMLYPNGLIMGKPLRVTGVNGYNYMEFTKHYYIGSERISTKTGTLDKQATKYILGHYPTHGTTQHMQGIPTAEVRQKSNARVSAAGSIVVGVFNSFGQTPPVLSPIVEGTIDDNFRHFDTNLNIYYFHPDHLGSSSYVSNMEGNICQHMEYLPFGETLVDEHMNTHNSPFRFNGKEYDEETGNYYYGARYYDPKLSIFISVDPLADKYPGMSSYAYCFNNPIMYIDPNGKDGVRIVDKQAKTITIKAVYFVQTADRLYRDSDGNKQTMPGYSKEDIATMKSTVNEYLNSLKSNIVSEGEYEGYTVKFDIDFKDGGNNASARATGEKYEGHSIGNSLEVSDERVTKYFKPQGEETATSRPATTGGFTQSNKNILMNKKFDTFMNKVHEIFHTFGFDHPEGEGGKQGIMKYPPANVSQQDINQIANDQFLPAVPKS